MAGQHGQPFACRRKPRPSPLLSLHRGGEEPGGSGYEPRGAPVATPLAIVQDAKDFLSTSTSPARKPRRPSDPASSPYAEMGLPRRLPALGSAPPTRGPDRGSGRDHSSGYGQRGHGYAAEPQKPLRAPSPQRRKSPRQRKARRGRASAPSSRPRRHAQLALGREAPAAHAPGAAAPRQEAKLFTLADLAAQDQPFPHGAPHGASASSSLVCRGNSHGSTPTAAALTTHGAAASLSGEERATCPPLRVTLGSAASSSTSPAQRFRFVSAQTLLPRGRGLQTDFDPEICDLEELPAPYLKAPAQLANTDSTVLAMEKSSEAPDDVAADDSTFEADPETFGGIFSDKGEDAPDDDDASTNSDMLDSVDGLMHPRAPMNHSFSYDSNIDDSVDSMPTGVVKGGTFTWVRGETLGCGMLGTVCKAMDQNTGQMMAVKEVLFDSQDQADDKFRAALQNEISLYKDLKHPQIVSYLGDDYIDGRLYIYLEYMAGGSISQMLSQFGAFDESLIVRYMRNLVEGLEYLHTRGPPILHRDIKGANILVGLDGTAKLSDFGCSKRSHHTAVHTLRGSVPWMAPEVMKEQGYGRKADIWSLGCVLIEMATAASPWGHFDNCIAAMVRIAMTQETPPIPGHLSNKCRSLTEACTRRNPKERPNATELLCHDLLSGAHSSPDEDWDSVA